MVIKLLIGLGVILYTIIVGIVINGVEEYKTNKSSHVFNDHKKLGVLIVPFLVDNRLLNFVIDSGATFSAINSNVLSKIKHIESERKTTTYGIEGNKISTNNVIIELSYINKNYSDEFQIMNPKVFDLFKDEEGVEIAGILGKSFLSKYKLKLDFEKMRIYPLK